MPPLAAPALATLSPPNSFPWIGIMLGVSTLIAVALACYVLYTLRKSHTPLSAAERAEWSSTPHTPLQKLAWSGLVLGVVQVLTIVGLFAAKGGAEAYWSDDDMRLQVVGVFLIGLIGSAVLMQLAVSRADEREKRVVRIAPQFQVIGLMLCVVAWAVYLGKSFHADGAIPMVYNYLSLGSFFIIFMVTWFVGVLLGGRWERFHGEG